MALHFCKSCGTLYDDKNGPCPRCATKGVMEQVAANAYEPPQTQMSEEEIHSARKRSWIQLLVGIPAFIGFIYLIFYIYRIVKGG